MPDLSRKLKKAFKRKPKKLIGTIWVATGPTRLKVAACDGKKVTFTHDTIFDARVFSVHVKTLLSKYSLIQYVGKNLHWIREGAFLRLENMGGVPAFAQISRISNISGNVTLQLAHCRVTITVQDLIERYSPITTSEEILTASLNLFPPTPQVTEPEEALSEEPPKEETEPLPVSPISSWKRLD